MAENGNRTTEQQSPRFRLYIALLLIAVVAVYARGLNGPFLLDDLSTIVDNATIRSLDTAIRTFGKPEALSDGSFVRFNYRPLLPVVYAVVYAVAGYKPVAYHLLNVLLHALNVLLISLLIRRLTASNFGALIAAAWWGLHPVHVEAVQNASGTDDLLLVTFAIASLLMVLNRRWVLSVVFFVLALLSKEAAIVVPGLVVLVAFWQSTEKLPRRIGLSILTGLPYLALAVVFVAVRFHFQGFGHSGSPVTSFAESLVLLPKIFLIYMRLAVAPLALRINYFIPINTIISAPVVVGYLAMLATLAAAVAYLKKAPVVSLGILWFYVAFFPVANIIPIRALVGERFMYLPYVGIAILIGAALSRIPKPKPSVIAAALVILAILATLSVARVGVWLDEERFWKDIIAKEPGFKNYQMYETNLGLYYMKQHRYPEAEHLFKQALQVRPDDPNMALNLAQIFLLTKQYKPAHQLFSQLVQKYPNNTHYRYGLDYATEQLTQPNPGESPSTDKESVP